MLKNADLGEGPQHARRLSFRLLPCAAPVPRPWGSSTEQPAAPSALRWPWRLRASRGDAAEDGDTAEDGDAAGDAVASWARPRGPTVLIARGKGQKNSCPALLPLLPASLYRSQESRAAQDGI